VATPTLAQPPLARPSSKAKLVPQQLATQLPMAVVKDKLLGPVPQKVRLPLPALPPRISKH
jgi:hypothetical protein